MSYEHEDFHCLDSWMTLDDLSPHIAPSSPRTTKDMRLLPQRHGWHAMSRQTCDLRENLSDLPTLNPWAEPGKAGTTDVQKKDNAIVCVYIYVIYVYVYIYMTIYICIYICIYI